MSRPWMPLYVGDYLADTQHFSTVQHGAYLLLIMHSWQHECLPPDEATRAAITRLTLKKWRAIRAPVEAKFRPDGRHKRILNEIEKVEKKIMQRRLSGARGGMISGINRTLAALTRRQATKQTASESQAKSKQPATIHKVSKKEDGQQGCSDALGAIVKGWAQ